MKNTDNNTNNNGSPNANNRLGTPNAPEQVTQIKPTLLQPLGGHSPEGELGQHIPANIVLAQLENDQLPVPLVTLQKGQDKKPDQAEQQGQDKKPDQAEQQGQDQKPDQAEQPGRGASEDSTLLSINELQALDRAAKDPSGNEGNNSFVANPFGNLDSVEDTRYDWDRPQPQEFTFHFTQDFTPELAEVTVEAPCVLPPIPGGQIITQTRDYYCYYDLTVFESGLCDGSGTGNTTTYLFGNLFDTIDTGIYCIEGIAITNLGLLYGSAVLNTSNADAWTLESDHFIFTLDTFGFGKGDYSYQLTNNVYNEPDGQGGNFLDMIFITLQPVLSPCECNYESNGDNSPSFSETNFINNTFDPALCDCLLPGPTDVFLQVKVVDDAQIAYDDSYYVPVICNGGGDCVPSLTDTSFNIAGNGALGDFNGLVSWNGTELTITLTNTSPLANGGYLTGLLLELPEPGLISNMPDVGNFQFMTSPAANQGQPFNPFKVDLDLPLDNIHDNGTSLLSYDKGYALGGNWEGGGNPNNGTAVGGSVTFTFTYGSNSLNIVDFYNFFNDTSILDKESNFVVRFKGFVNDGSDKVPGDVVCEDGNNGTIIGNVLLNDTSSADRLPDSDSTTNGMTVYKISINGVETAITNPNLSPDITTVKGGTLHIYPNGSFDYTPPAGGLTQDDVITYFSHDSDNTSRQATLTFTPTGKCECEEESFESFSLFSSFSTDNSSAPVASDDQNNVSETNLTSGSNPDSALLSVSGNILDNDSFDAPVEIVSIAGIDILAADLISGFKIVSTTQGEIKVFLVSGGGHNQGDYVYTLVNASANASDVISYSILSNSLLSTANITISIADDVPSAESHSFVVSEQPIVSGQLDGMVVSTGNVLDGAKSGADVMPVSYTPKVAVDEISFNILNLSNADQSSYLALGAVITILAGNISKVALAVPLNGDTTFGLPDGSEMTIGSDGHYSLAQPVNGISADKAYAFSYEITDNDGSKATADLNITVKNFDAPLANQDNIWSFDSGTSKINVLDNDVLNGSVTVKEISYKDVNNLTQTISVPTSGNGSNAFTASFTTHSGAVVKIDRNGNLEYKPGAEANGQSDIDTLSYKIVETGNSSHSSIGQIEAHIFDSNADYHNLLGNNGNNILDASDLTGTVSMTGSGGNNEFKIDLSNPSASNQNPTEIAITDLFKVGANNTVTFTHVSDTDGVIGLGIGDVISSISSVSQLTTNGDIHVSFNNGTHVAFQDPGFTMSMPTANEFMAQLQEHAVTVSAQV